MAGRRGRLASLDLLSKLKEGQGILKKSIENIQASPRTAATSQALLRQRKFDGHCRDSLTVDLNRASNFPKKRARLQQLSPAYEDSLLHRRPTKQARPSHTSPAKPLPSNASPRAAEGGKRARHTSPAPNGNTSHHHHHHHGSPQTPTGKRPRRISSTPIKSPHQKVRWREDPPSPSTDLSLEEALFHESSKENLPDSYACSLPSPKLSRISVDTSRNAAGGSVKPSLRKSGQERKKRRGLTVSFVQNSPGRGKGKSGSRLCPGSSSGGGGCTGGSKRSFTRHATQRNLDDDRGAELVDSLNASRYGALERHHAQPHQGETSPGGFPTAGGRGEEPCRLGYDWIAGLLDASESYLSERDDEYFQDMKEFRRVNFEECHRPKETPLPGSDLIERRKDSDGTLEEDEDSKTTCVKSYVLNDRLFPVHMDHAPGSVCPACEDKLPSQKLPTSSRYLRVSVPHSVLQPTPQFRPHRRRSFDASDSMGLARHCVAGWETAKPSMFPPQPSLALKSSLPKQDYPHTSHLKSCEESESGHNLLDTSHTIEYSLRSRAADK